MGPVICLTEPQFPLLLGNVREAMPFCRSVSVRSEEYKHPAWAWHTVGATLSSIVLHSMCHLCPRTGELPEGSDRDLHGLPPATALPLLPPLTLA
jgi:hypothetical protein